MTPSGRRCVGVVCIIGVAAATSVSAAIDTHLLEQAWPRQWVHTYEVRKYAVQWRERASATEGIFAGASFTAPTPLEQTWHVANDYQGLGPVTPGVSAVRILEHTATREVIQIDIKILWKTLTLTFEIEQDSPHATRFSLRHEAIGDYRGVCLLHPQGQQTAVELATWFHPAVRVPVRLVLSVERIVMLHGIRDFLGVCERAARQAPST